MAKISNKRSNYKIKDAHSFYEPVYTIGVAAEKLGTSVHSLRLYEYEGLIITHKTKTGRRLYSDLELGKIRCIQKMIKEEGLNFEGIRRLLALVPCWRIRNCDSETGHRCIAAYGSRTKPCWVLEEKCIHPYESCRDCPVYREIVHCDDVQKMIHSELK